MIGNNMDLLRLFELRDLCTPMIFPLVNMKTNATSKSFGILCELLLLRIRRTLSKSKSYLTSGVIKYASVDLTFAEVLSLLA